jgi:hypothetical protein
LVGVAAFCWVIWISRNDTVFHKSHYISILQVMFRGLTRSGVGPSYQRKRGGSFWRKVADWWRLWRWRSSINRVGTP